MKRNPLIDPFVGDVFDLIVSDRDQMDGFTWHVWMIGYEGDQLVQLYCNDSNDKMTIVVRSAEWWRRKLGLYDLVLYLGTNFIDVFNVLDKDHPIKTTRNGE